MPIDYARAATTMSDAVALFDRPPEEDTLPRLLKEGRGGFAMKMAFSDEAGMCGSVRSAEPPYLFEDSRCSISLS